MLYYAGLLFLVIAVSIDGFGVGMTYGMRKIRVPFLGLCIIMSCSGAVVLLSMTLGDYLKSFISPHLAEVFGGIILISLGIFSFINAIRSQRNKDKEETTVVDSIHGKEQHGKFKSVTSVFSTPDKADLDRSGIITAGEATILGTALAMDAFGAGFGAAIIGYAPWLTSILIAIMSGGFLYTGIKLGMILSKNKRLLNLAFIAPILLITIGVLNII
ncbi:sporulation membrane protein YtaF [Virgibacillus soli]|uniref:Sporulation membrane protein YtaF n=1 Tax=Paracerasibacillus soli TaxID=480284 RepID=A0ABU5CRR8_9BACI|nr:sporulation membrane protein YtaF [Virgibacillus soli]MDY0409036.1 sporulation membrane protein YtaF [Virgibacillus soli]